MICGGVCENSISSKLISHVFSCEWWSSYLNSQNQLPNSVHNLVVILERII